VLLPCDNFLNIISNGPTRGHAFKLYTPESRVNCRQHFFAVRVIKVWNSLPDEVVAADRLSMLICRLKDTNMSQFILSKI